MTTLARPTDADPRDRGTATRRRAAGRARHGPAPPGRRRRDRTHLLLRPRREVRARGALHRPVPGRRPAGTRRPGRRGGRRRRAVPPGHCTGRATASFPGRSRPPRTGRHLPSGRPARRPAGAPAADEARHRPARPLPGGSAALPPGTAGDPRGAGARAVRCRPAPRGEELPRRCQGDGGRRRGGAARRDARPGGPAALRAGASAPARAVARRPGARARRPPRRVAPGSRPVGRRWRCGGPPPPSRRCTPSPPSAAGRARSTPRSTASQPGPSGWPRSHP